MCLRFVSLWLIALTIACTPYDTFPTIPPHIEIPTPSPTPALEEAWQPIATGLEKRFYIPNNILLAQMMAVSIDPQHHNFRVHYSPGEPLTLTQWRDLLPDAVVIVNANFFNPENTVEGMLIADGVPHGRAYTQRGGMFTWRDGVAGLRVNRLEPYQPGEAIEQAVQAFPMLVIDGQASFTDASQQRPTRRTVIGMDTAGRVIIMATPALGLGLFDLSAYLPTTDIGFDRALNLDGGRSTMLYIAPDYFITSVEPVPAVLAIYQR